MNGNVKTIGWLCATYALLIVALTAIFVVAKLAGVRPVSSQVVIGRYEATCAEICKEYGVLTNQTYVCDKHLTKNRKWNFSTEAIVGFGKSGGAVSDCRTKLSAPNACICHRK
jgi:hypothetical protein